MGTQLTELEIAIAKRAMTTRYTAARLGLSEETVDEQSDRLNVQQAMIDHLNTILQRNLDTLTINNDTTEATGNTADTPTDIVPTPDT